MSTSPTTSDSAPAADHNQWFADEVQPHGSKLKSYLRGAFPSVRDVDDVVQESYVRIWRARAAHPILSAKAFLFQIASRLAIDWLRHDRASPIEAVADLAALSVIEDRASSADRACTDEEIDLLGQAIATLPPRCREIMVLRKLQGMSQKAIAEKLGISENTVQGQVQRGLKRCEKLLQHRGIRGINGE